MAWTIFCRFLGATSQGWMKKFVASPNNNISKFLYINILVENISKYIIRAEVFLSILDKSKYIFAGFVSGCEKFSPGVSSNAGWQLRSRPKSFRKVSQVFRQLFVCVRPPDSSSLSSSMSFWSNKTEDGNKQFPTCSVRYVLSVESMIRWRWIALVGIFQSSPWLMVVFRHVEPGASSLPVAHAFSSSVALP